MSDDNHEARRLRINDSASLDQATRDDRTPSSPGSLTVLGRTTTITTYPTSAQRFYAVVIQTVTGTQTEGSTGTLTAQPGMIFAFNIGSAIPPSGTYIICRHVRHRWVFQYDG